MSHYPKALRRCFYKGCDSKQNTHPQETFFQFPIQTKDPDRYKVWVQLSQCDETPASKFLCSKHFDASKYIAKNPRRNLLLSAAIPYRYEPPEEEEEEEEFEEDVEEEPETSGEGGGRRDGDCEPVEQEHVESTMNEYDEEFAVEQLCDDEHLAEVVAMPIRIPANFHQKENDYSSDDEIIYCNANESELNSSSSSAIKRKADKSIIPVIPAKNLKLIKNTTVESTTKSTKPKSTLTKMTIITTADDFDESKLLPGGPDVSTFIFKGEEFIQMPKTAFIKDKIELFKQLQMYKSIIAKVKSNVDDVKL